MTSGASSFLIGFHLIQTNEVSEQGAHGPGGVLKALGFLSPDGVPTERYNIYRDGNLSRSAMTAGLREGWAGLLLVDQRAYERSPAQLTELFKRALLARARPSPKRWPQGSVS